MWGSNKSRNKLIDWSFIKIGWCVNLLDEAAKKGIRVDTDCLSRRLGVPVLGISARNGAGVPEAIAALENFEASDHALCPDGDATELASLAHALAAEAVSLERADPTERDRRIDRI